MTADRGTGPSGPAGPGPKPPEPPTPRPRDDDRLHVDRVDDYRIDARRGELLVAYAVRDAWGWTALRRQAGRARFVGRHVDTVEAAATLLTFYVARYPRRDRFAGRLRFAI